VSVCACCGGPTFDGAEICAHHLLWVEEPLAWSDANRIMCDFIHRGIEPPVPPGAMPLEELWVAPAELAEIPAA
jgi:hypothetical protein